MSSADKTTKNFLNSQKSITSGWLQVSIGLGLFSGFLLIAQAWFLASAINGVIFEKQTLAEVQNWLWMLLAVFLVRAFLAWASEKAAFHASAKIKQQLRDKLHRHLLNAGPITSGNEASGERVNTLVDGIEALENYYARYLPAMSLIVLVPLSILVFVFPIDWISATVMLVTAPLIPFFMILIGKGTESLNKKQWRKLARMSAHFLDMIQGLTTLKIFNTSKREADLIARISDDYRRSTMSVLRVAFLSSLVLEFLATVSIAMVAVLIGFRLYYGQMDFLLGFFVLLLAPEFYLPLRNMGTHYHARMEAIGAAEQMVEILDTSVGSSSEEHTLQTSIIATDIIKNNKQKHTPPLFNDSVRVSQVPAISFNKVNFSYEEGRQALDDFSLEIKAGERIALIGESGAGKSTVANLLLGFIQLNDDKSMDKTTDVNKGEIQVDGVNLNSLGIENWRKYIAWVPQRPYLFHGTIADNIRLGAMDAADDAVKKAAELANAAEFIESFTDGYETMIGEKGEGLSGGQIQRIALARAFLKDAPVLILDEATANLDKTSEKLIQKSIKRLSKGKTVITIAHRLNTIKDADKIVVMDKGRVVEIGTHQQLLSSNNSSQTNVTNYKKMLAVFEGMENPA
ncbi:MAG: thiol reductant ABC exporter subunit CydD [Cocleimonas sp.]|nr:thiol reductant ABC exporter subunit CydD [Cocleimonas sp.]